MQLLTPALGVPALILLAAAAWDLASREIPDAFPISLLLWAIASRILGFQEPHWGSLAAGAALGLLIALAVFAWMGGGDGKLLVGIGAVLGPVGLLLVLPWIGVLGGISALSGRWRDEANREVAYGPAIAVGYALAILI